MSLLSTAATVAVKSGVTRAEFVERATELYDAAALEHDAAERAAARRHSPCFYVVGVLAGAYRGGRKNLRVTLSHAVAANLTGEGLAESSLCGRMHRDHLADEHVAEPQGSRPSCSACARRLEKIPGAIVLGRPGLRERMAAGDRKFAENLDDAATALRAQRAAVSCQNDHASIDAATGRCGRCGAVLAMEPQA